MWLSILLGQTTPLSQYEVPRAGLNTSDQMAEAQAKAAQQPAKRQRRRKSGEEPIQLVKDSWILDGITDFFGIRNDFPLRQQLVSRSGIKDDRGARKIYFVSSGGPSISLQHVPKLSQTLRNHVNLLGHFMAP